MYIHPSSKPHFCIVYHHCCCSTYTTQRSYLQDCYCTLLSVYHAHCTCVAGKSGMCNHVAALTFALDEYDRDIATHGNKGQASCTFIPAKWGAHAVRVPMEPMEVMEMHCVKPSLGKVPHSPPKRSEDWPPPSNEQIVTLSCIMVDTPVCCSNSYVLQQFHNMNSSIIN